MRIVLFLDTNVYVHCRPLEEIEWDRWRRAQGSDVEGIDLVVPRTVIEELDKLKDRRESRRVADRARKALGQIETWHEQALRGGEPEVRRGVRVLFPSLGRTVDPASLDLDPQRADNRLIASMVAWTRTTDGANVLLISGDTTPRTTARALGFRATDVEEAWRLPSELTDEERELRELRTELASLRQRLPRLRLAFQEGPGVVDPQRLVLVVPSKFREPTAEWTRAMDVAAALVPDPAAQNTASESSTEPPVALDTLRARLDAQIARQRRGDPPTPEEFARYERERAAFLASYRADLARAWEGWCDQHRTFPLIFVLINEGTAPAEDIDIAVHIPDGPEVEEGEWTAPASAVPIPPPPRPPSAPRSSTAALRELIEQVTRGPHVNGVYLPNLDGLRAVGPRNVSGISVRRTQSYDVDFHVRSLKHNCSVAADPLRGAFPHDVEPRSFTIHYVLRCATLPSPVEGELHVVVTSEVAHA